MSGIYPQTSGNILISGISMTKKERSCSHVPRQVRVSITSDTAHRSPCPVLDVNVSFTDNKVKSLSASPSNGTVVAISSMPSIDSEGFLTLLSNIALREANRNLSTVEEFTAKYELAMSKIFALWLVINTFPAPAHLVQRRVTKVITKLPMAALWLLVLANLLFALFAVVLAVLAIRNTSPEVREVHTRLTTTGLAAQLFDWKHSRRAARRDVEFFRENTGLEEKEGVRKRVGIRQTEFGGAEFVAYEVIDEKDGKGYKMEMWSAR
jgi:hypothetical protein